MKPIPMVGPSYQQSSLPFDAERTINMYPVLDQSGKTVSALYGREGLSLLQTIGSGPIRDNFFSTQNRAFAVSGSQLYEFTLSGSTLMGTLLTASGNITIDENQNQLIICDGNKVYTLTYATNVFAVVTSANLPSVGTITVIDGYCVANVNGSGRFQISSINDATTWAALDFATATSSPDVLLRVLNAAGTLWLMGDYTIEPWIDRGGSLFPFARISGSTTMQVGILAPYTAVSLDNTLFWVGKDKNGYGAVYRADGFTPLRISTDTIDKLIQTCPNPTGLISFTYQRNGHVFFVISGGGMTTSPAYDLSTKQWVEFAYLNSDGSYGPYLGNCAISGFGNIIVGDRTNSNLYTMSDTVYSDNGNPLCRDRIYTHLYNNGDLFSVNSLFVDVEAGVGLEGKADPQMMLSISRDGGRTYIANQMKSMGATGQFQTRVKFDRLGQARQLTMRTRVTDPVKLAMTGAYIS